GVVLAEDARRPHHLVDAGRGGERCDVTAELGFERDRQAEGEAIASLGVGQHSRHLPEVRLLLAGGGTECRGVDDAEPLGQDPKTPASQDLAGVMSSLLEVLGAADAEGRDGERGVSGQRWVVSAGPYLLGPDLAGDVDQDAAAVAFAVDVPGAVEHLSEIRQRQLDRRSVGGRILADRRVYGARIPVL